MFLIFIVIFSILVQITAAFIALRLIKTTGNLWSWTLIASAMVLQASRRILILAELISGQLTAFEAQTSESIGLIISMLMLTGVASIETFFIAQTQSITEHKQKEKELLKASTDRYKALFISSRDAVMTIEPPSWKFTSGNPATIEMFRTKDEEAFLNHEPWVFSPELQPDGRNSMEKAKEMIDKAMRDGSNFFEWTHKRLTGEEFPAEVLLSRVEQKGKTFLHATVRDIAERKKLEEKVKEYAEEKFKIIFDNTNDGMLLADSENTKFVLANNAICQMLGYTPEELKTLSVADIHPKNDLVSILEQFNRLAKGELKIASNIPVKRKNNSIFFADVNSSIVNLEGKKYLLGVFRDITERKKTEEELKRTVEKLKELDKLKDNFLNVTTHELKAPLVPIGSQTQLLLAGNYGKLTQKQQEALEMILRNEKSLNRLTGDVLDIAKIRSNKFKLILQKTSLDKAITETVRGLEKTAEENRITLSLSPIPKLPQITIDGGRIEQVLSNLLDNALKFTPTKGKIKVKVQKKNNDIVVTVKDTGIGLSRENIEKIFTPFFQVESDLARKYRGTGLGLAICKGIIETHGGHIWAESEGEGKGSTFSFSLPIKTK